MSQSLPNTTTRFTLKLTSVKHDLQVLGFDGAEQISQPYVLRVQLVSENPNLVLKSFLHQQAFLSFDSSGHGIHGQIHSIERGESGKRLTHYNLTLVPRLAYLQHRFNQRIFQNKSVPEIIAQVLEEHGILLGDYRFDLGPTVYPRREYCTQFAESDLNLIQRLCAVEGIHFHHEHSASGHVLVFGDDHTVFPRLAPTLFNTDAGMVAEQPTIKQFSVRLEARTSRVSRRDYDFQQPHLLMQSADRGNHPDAGKDEPDLEDYRYPGGFHDEQRGRHLAGRALERHRSDYQLATGNSDVPRLVSGHYLDLKQHPTAENNELWLLTRVVHKGRQPQVLEESAAVAHAEDGFTQGYRNSFEATPWRANFRPPLSHETPYIRGSQSAVVTGPAGEEIHCDELGRVKVQFHWDRHGQGDEHSSCWLRVASSWAGDAYGSVVIPRVGMEVVVSFWEGCPDQPYISGCVINPNNSAPYPLPANKTRSVFKTLSYPGGQGKNELRIEDRKGAEEIYLHAERDLQQLIKHDQTITVGNQRHDTVSANSYTQLKAEEHRTTAANRSVKVGAADYLDIAQSQHVKTGIGQYVDAGQEIHLKAGSKIVIEAGAELTLCAGGSSITLNPSGVWLNGAVVATNIPLAIASAPPAVGSGIQQLTAQLPGVAPQSQVGAVPKRALVKPQTALMNNATGKPRCAICEACREKGFALTTAAK